MLADCPSDVFSPSSKQAKPSLSAQAVLGRR